MSVTSPANLAVIDDQQGLAALLSPLRRRILSELHKKPRSATGLSRKLGLARQKVNYHFRSLEKAGLLELDSEEQRRGCTERIFRPAARAYLVNPDFLGELESDAATLRDRFSSSYLVTLAARVVRDVARLREGADRAGKPLTTLALHVDVRFSVPAQRTAFVEELTETMARLAVKYQSDLPTAREYRFILGGHPVPRTTRDESEAKVS